jgi:hypothetical protein
MKEDNGNQSHKTQSALIFMHNGSFTQPTIM